jgi:hypothetical protein
MLTAEVQVLVFHARADPRHTIKFKWTLSNFIETRTNMSAELTKKEARAQQAQQQSASQGARDVETQEHHAKASASGGLNLNLFGALSGALSSASKKTTHTNADGSSTSVEDRHDKGRDFFPSTWTA